MIKIVAENYIKEEYQEEFLKLTKELIILSATSLTRIKI